MLEEPMKLQQSGDGSIAMLKKQTQKLDYMYVMWVMIITTWYLFGKGKKTVETEQTVFTE